MIVMTTSVFSFELLGNKVADVIYIEHYCKYCDRNIVTVVVSSQNIKNSREIVKFIVYLRDGRWTTFNE